MVVEAVGSETAQVAVGTVETANSLMNESVLNGPIKFGSHGEEPVKVEINDVAESNMPKDVVDEWPAPKEIHSFYFPRFRPYDDPKVKAKIDLVDKEIQKRKQSRFQLTEILRAKRSERSELSAQIKALIDESKQFKSILDEKKKEIEPLQQALGKLRGNNATRGGICSSEEELNDLIYSLQYRIQHESIPLTEEKQILREMKQLEGTREQVIANSAMRAKIQDTLGKKEALQDQVKLMGNNLDGVKKERSSLQAKIDDLWTKREALNVEIEDLEKELTTVTQKRDEAFTNLTELRKQRDDVNAHFAQSRNLLIKAREVAAKKDVKGLKELSESEMENFMSLWCNKTFRSDYEKRLLPSLDSRQLSRDGRMRNPDEKPLVVVETPVVSEPGPKPVPNKLKEEPKPAPPKDTLPPQKVQKGESKAELKATLEKLDSIDEEIGGMEKVQKQPDKVIDEAKLKELKREEEIVKAKQAMERKKKLAEKAAVKAAVRAQKEAEKKLKEREKKMKKKNSAAVPASESEEQTATVEEAVGEEPQQVEEKDETPVPASASVKEKDRREGTIRYKNRGKASDALPKAILRRKKSTNYWLYAAPAAVVVVLLLAMLGMLGYTYLH